MKVAVLYNHESKNVINLFGQLNKEKIGLETLRRISDALRQGKHQVRTFEADKDIISRLEEFMPRVIHGERPGLVFNVSYGIQGRARYTHVPSILEMVGIPYLGSGPTAHSIALDKAVTKMILIQHSLPTADFAVLQGSDFTPPDIGYPLIAKPRHEAVSFGVRIVDNEEELRTAVRHILDTFGQDVLVERFIEGLEINVGLIGNQPVEALPLVLLQFPDARTIYTYEDKTGRSGRPVTHLCPAPVGKDLWLAAQELARRTFSAVGCSDFARVDMRADKDGNLYVLEINSLPSLGPHSSYVLAAGEAGFNFAQLVNRLVTVASGRYFGTPAPPRTSEPKDPQSTIFTFLTEHRHRIERRLSNWTKRTSRTLDPTGLRNAARECKRVFEELALRAVPELTIEDTVYTWETEVGMEGGTLLVAHLDVPLDRDMTTQLFRRDAGWLYGEGTGCSRAPVVVTEYALRALRHARLLRKRKIGTLFYLDEGQGCSRSRDTIRAAMARAKQTLVLVPSNAGNAVAGQRRGERKYRLVLTGRSIRSGKSPKQDDPLLWLSKRIVELSSLGSREQRLSVSVTSIHTEAFPMSTPHRLRTDILVTFGDADTVDKAEQRIRNILDTGGQHYELELVSDRPPMLKSRQNQRLAKSLTRLAEEWDMPLRVESSTWPSVAGLAPESSAVLCGLGPVARNLYTPQEAVERISLIQRTLLLAQFLLIESEKA